MRARLAAIVSGALGAFGLAGCNQILGNGNFVGPGGNDASSIDAPPGTPDASPPDASMLCQDMSLPPTTIKGTVFAPNGTLPLANALVYVPRTTPSALPSGVFCGCIPATGGAVTSFVTKADGTFTLTDPPTGTNIPLVIQVGKWRKQLVLPSVPQCMETDVPPSQSNLPRNASEGDMPMIAVSTGASDNLECLLRQVGIADTEFGTLNGTGHVQMVTDPKAPGITNAGGALAPQAALISTLSTFDHVMFACPGMEVMPAAAQAQELSTYADAGGQVFLEHFHSGWISMSPEWSNYVQFSAVAASISNATVTIDTTFAKAQLLTSWMIAIGESSTAGQFPEINARSTVQTVDSSKVQTWVHLMPGDAQGLSGDEVLSFSSNPSCGRTIFSDMHATGAPVTATTFPAECPAMAMTPQEDAIAFLLFDEDTCLQ